MSTTHILLGMAKRNAIGASAGVPLCDRVKATTTLDVAALSGGGSVTVILESSPTALEGTWTQLVSFGVIAAEGTTVKQSPAHFVLGSHIRFVRANLIAIVGEVTAELRLEAPFFDVTNPNHTVLLSKELRGFADGLGRICDEAEEFVLLELTDDDGAIDANMMLAGFADSLRLAIVHEAEHLFRRHKLAVDGGSSSLVSLRSFPNSPPGLMNPLNRFRNVTSVAWRGR